MSRSEIIHTINHSNVVTTSSSTPFNVDRANKVAAQCVITVNTPSPTTFVDADVNTATDVITKTAHGYPTTGLKVRLTTSGVLPTGLSLATDYFVIVLTADTYQLASSLANAQAGTAVNITAAAGGGTHTVTATALAGATVTLEKSNNYRLDGVTASWTAVATASAISATSEIWITDTSVEYRWARLTYTLTAGQLSAASYVNLKKGDV